ncbi:MAG TPA: LanC-like protein [Gaiellaceae bacterium]|nr:LanC-like protein [Gaiellaceae bacterium]
MLYDPAAFEPLTEETWDDQRVRAGIQRIVSDADEAYDQDDFWPANEWDAWESRLPLKTLYAGASGIVWALDALQRRGHAETKLDLSTAATRALERLRAEPEFLECAEVPSPSESSLLLGETGPLLVAWRLSPSADLAETLLARIRENVDNEADEVMWGSPGTILAARAMHEWTGEERWAEALRESAEALLDRREASGLWLQRLYGNEYRFLGPVHGLVGNVLALLPEHDLRSETARILTDEAIVEDGFATWPAGAGGELAPPSGIRLQWCHGAPGMVSTAADYLDEELLLAGAELTWLAGAHGPEKGVGLCHGTAGNGYALLKTFARTGDEVWLERARRFAVHALKQAENAPGRYSLFTGDVGAALYASCCLNADARFPILDGWD